MSKTLFNQNVFQSKNVTNSDDVSSLKVDTFKATTLTATTIINAELQAATAGVATNTAAIANTANDFTAAYPLVKSTRTPPLTDAISVLNVGVVTDGSTALIQSGAVFTGLASKQAVLVAGDGIALSGPANSTVSFDGTISQNITTDAINTITGGSLKYIDGGVVTDVKTKIDAANVIIGNNTSAIVSHAGLIGANTTAIGANATLIGANATAIGTKQDTLTDLANGGIGINISGAGLISADTYGAESNGGLAISGTRQFSLDFSNLNTDINIPQQVIIRNDDEPQLLVGASSNTAQDVAISIRGSKNGNTSSREAQLRFENYDHDLGDENLLGEIGGFVLDSGTNVGGLIFGNYADGNTGKSALSMNQNGKFNFTGSVPRNSSAFQDEVKINVDGDVFVRQGLVLEPFDMGVTTFSNGRTDSASSSASREKIYIKFLPFGDTDGSDWFYLREISTGTNAGHLALDFHDDTNDVRFSIRNVHSSGQDPDVITEVFDVKSAGVTAHTAVYRIPQMIFYNFDPAQLGNNESGNAKWGKGGIQDVLIATPRITGTQLASFSAGTITISNNGYYRIKVSSNPQTDNYNDRLAFAVYLQIGLTSYFENAAYNFFGWSYTRNNTDGAHASITFEDYIYISAGTEVRVRNKVDTDDLGFNNEVNEDNVENYLNIQIERIAETDIT